jgi:hypothetical protein
LTGKRPDKSKGTLRTSSTEHAKKSMRASQFDTATEHLRKTISLDPGRTGAFILLGAVMEIREGVSRHEKIIEPLFLSILLTNPPSETFRDQLQRDGGNEGAFVTHPVRPTHFLLQLHYPKSRPQFPQPMRYPHAQKALSTFWSNPLDHSGKRGSG